MIPTLGYESTHESAYDTEQLRTYNLYELSLIVVLHDYILYDV